VLKFKYPGRKSEERQKKHKIILQEIILPSIMNEDDAPKKHL